MSDMEKIWREKSDEDLLEAAASLSDFTEEGQEVVRAELRRRGLEDPFEQVSGLAAETTAGEPEERPQHEPVAGEDVSFPEPECLRCHAQMRYRGIRTILGEPGNLFASADNLDLYICPKCGHVELFTNEAD